MIEPDLTRLKDAPVPPPEGEAKRAALAAAMAAFEKSAAEAQGSAAPQRLSYASSPSEGKRKMRQTFYFNRALAASIAALMIGAPAAFMLSRNYAPGGGSISSPPIGRAAPPTEVAVAPRMEAPAAVQPAPAPSAPREERAKTAGALGGRADGVAAPPPRLAGSVRDGAAQRLSRSIQPAKPVAAMNAEGVRPPMSVDTNVAPESEFRDRFESKETNPVKSAATEPVSTFSIDVDTASYAFARRALNAGRLPPKDSVRVEEFVNYFPYDYPKPESAQTPFKPTITVTPSPWSAGNRLVHVAIQGYALQSAERPRANLVFLIDVSGSMSPQDRLPLVKNALRMLVDELKPEDTVAVVTYASGSGVALEPTKIADKAKILAAIDALGAGDSTAGAQGIQDAYRLAESNFDKTAVNRVILATDGDFNVGVTDQSELKGLIERKREKGVFLSILGVGQGNYNDALMQALAQNGNGAAVYVDTLNEARKALVDEASSTLFPIAKDVKIQVEWNPARVSEYRLIGYETRALRREDFNNDKVDAGDVGSGHRVTAIYEITPVDAEKKLVDDLRYGKKTPAPVAAQARAESELGFLKLRYKLPKEEASRLITQPIAESPSVESIAHAPQDVRFSIAVAAFAQLLKGAPYLGEYGYDDVIALAQGAKGDDPFGYRAEFVNLARLAKSARP
ncbi:VWA domain-containing protein [Methylocystis sp. L43]|uniref:vWA domain-containing protein n=1 Tax=unclassified Methylocystis TaxID=2625913 RepID=UPI0018C281B2|nr:MULTISPECIES: VWA domain-containing protein [unclassified Methylocystis]MBG0798228.1 VWA domain-containing protein [Methylocystis sp. L43]MBG0805687.1 VWA domain-containing protein [Methylocystis sp. H15]